MKLFKIALLGATLAAVFCVLGLFLLSLPVQPEAPAMAAGSIRVALPQTFVMIDIRPGIQDAYYRCPDTWGGEQNNTTGACEKIPVNMTFNGSVYGPWSGFQMQAHLMGEPYFNNPIIPWAKNTIGLFGRVYIYGAEADGELRTQIPADPSQDNPAWHLGTFKKGVDTVIPFDGLYTDFGAVNQYTTVKDAMNFEVNARVFLRVEIFGYYTTTTGPTATPIPPTNTPQPTPTNTPIPPTPTPTNTPIPPTPLAAGCAYIAATPPANDAILCYTPVVKP